MADRFDTLYARGRGWGYGPAVSAIVAVTFPLIEWLPNGFWRALARIMGKNPDDYTAETSSEP